MRWVTSLLFLVCVPLSGWIGYEMGKSSGLPASPVSTSTPDATTNQEHAHSAHSTREQPQSQSIGNQVEQPRSASIGSTPYRPTAQQANAQYEQADELQETGQQLQRMAQEQRQHLDQRTAFEQSFSSEQEDWQAKTRFTDFLQLHPNAANVELHKIFCSSRQCQLIGQFEGQHDGWEAMIEDMKQQDWWDYQGTSSTSSTRDGITYFTLFVDKPGT